MHHSLPLQRPLTAMLKFHDFLHNNPSKSDIRDFWCWYSSERGVREWVSFCRFCSTPILDFRFQWRVDTGFHRPGVRVSKIDLDSGFQGRKCCRIPDSLTWGDSSIIVLVETLLFYETFLHMYNKWRFSSARSLTFVVLAMIARNSFTLPSTFSDTLQPPLSALDNKTKHSYGW